MDLNSKKTCYLLKVRNNAKNSIIFKPKNNRQNFMSLGMTRH